MKLLLDTQIFLWFLADSPKLTKSVRRQIDVADQVFVSAASIWEATIKLSIGKLEVQADRLVSGIEESGFEELPVRAVHAAGVARLRPIHRDPFDRLLIAQAIEEPMRFLTADKLLSGYSELVTVI